MVALADAVAAASGLVMTKTARVPAALVRGLDAMSGDAPPGPARALVRTPADDLFRESVPVAVAAASSSDAFGPGEVSREVLEDAIVVASTDPGAARCSFVAVDSTAARRRLFLAVVPAIDDPVRSAPALVVPCVPAAAGPPDAATFLAAGAAIRSLVIALRGLGLAWAWDPDQALDSDRARAALALDTDLRPFGIVAVGRCRRAAPDGPPGHPATQDVRSLAAGPVSFRDPIRTLRSGVDRRCTRTAR